MKKYLTFIINIIYILILNILLAVLIFKHISILSILFYILEAISFGTIISIISNISKNRKINKCINLLILIIISILFIAQFVHYNFYACFFSFFSLLNGGQVFGFLEAIIKVIIENIWGFLVFILFLIAIIFIIIKAPRDRDRKANVIMVSFLLVSMLVTSVLMFSIRNGTFSPYNLIKNTHNHTQNIKQFGYLTASFIDIERFIFGFEPMLLDEDLDYNYSLEDEKEYNVTYIDFNSLINNESNERIKKLYQYLSKREPSNKNKYTGIFDGKNLIFITAESFNFNIIDKDITPTLYKLKEEGITFDNFYTPIYYASTSDGEYTNLTGLLPSEGTWSYIKSKDNYYPYSYGNVFKNSDYKTYSYHNGIYNFYDRNEVQLNFGYEYFKGCGNGLEKYINCNLWPQSDLEMLSSTFSDYQDASNFSVYYMTISGHLSHNFNTNDIASKWKENTDSLKYSEHVRAYISGNIDLDKGLEALLKYLEDNDLLDDTVIVITPDHFPYGLNKSEISEFQDLDYDYDLHQSNLIIYNSEIKAEKIEKYSSNIDILPTLLNMFGINYDSRLIIGQDIMSDSDGIVIFNDQSFLTDQGYYNAKTNNFSNKDVSQSYITSKQTEVYNKMNASRIMLYEDIYKNIFN